jgi:hypothetical protein
MTHARGTLRLDQSLKGVIMTHAAAYIPKPIPLLPGYLMAPFGWAAAPLTAMVQADPTLIRYLFTMSRRRMHLTALAFAHLSDDARPPLGGLLLAGRPAEVLDATLGRRPLGLARAFEHLPVKVIGAAGYRQLVNLLNDPAAARVIYHAQNLDESLIASLHDVPAPLRRIVGDTSEELVISLAGFPESLRLLVARGAAPSFDALVADLASTRRPRDLMARLAKLAGSLPLPDSLPPSQVAGARRIDSASEVVRLARKWKNCLAEFVDEVNGGQAAIYLWPDQKSPAACFLRRLGRVGWIFDDAKGPENAELPPPRAQEIRDAFAAIDIPGSSELLNWLAESDEGRRYRWPRRRAPNDEEASKQMYGEFEAG